MLLLYYNLYAFWVSETHRMETILDSFIWVLNAIYIITRSLLQEKGFSSDVKLY